MSHAAREPASRIGTARNTNATASPRQPNAIARREQHERRQHREHRAELQIAGAEDAGEPLGFGGAAEAVAGRSSARTHR